MQCWWYHICAYAFSVTDDVFTHHIDSEQKQLNRSVQTYLTKCWRGPADREDFTDEIETKMSQLELHELEKNDDRAQEYDADMVQRTTIEKTKLTVEIAMLYLGIYNIYCTSAP